MAISVERYITVCHPFFRLSHNWSVKRYIIPIVILALGYNLPKLWELKVVQVIGKLFSYLIGPIKASVYYPDSSRSSPQLYIVDPTQLRVNKKYILYYTVWSNLFINGKKKEKRERTFIL